MNRDLIDDTPALQTQYESLVVTYIREKYSVNEELAILRKHIAGIDSVEFKEYNNYVEDCKKRAKEVAQYGK